MAYENIPPEQLILRDHLAIHRTTMANERTFLAYLRTALMISISGVTLIKFFEGQHHMVFLGYALTLAGIVVGWAGYRRYASMAKRISLNNHNNNNKTDSSSTPSAHQSPM